MYQASRRSVSAVLQSPQLLRVLSAPYSSTYSALADQRSRDSGSKQNGSTSGREFSGFTGKFGAGYGYSFAKSPRINVKLPGFTRLESTSAVQEEGASAAVSDGLVEKHEYQAEVSRLMDLIVHSLYSNKEVFLRELVSNASDALDKLRFLSVTDPGLLGDGGELEIRIKPDKEKGMVTILDTGIGMTKEELVDCLGTIAQSGTAKFFQALKDSKESGDSNLIGQFGVGFYSAFLVSKKVVVSTKSPKSNKQYVWEGEADNNTYVIREETDPSKLISRGTQITLHLKDDDLKLADPEKLIGLVKNYSQFVSFPIYIWKEKVQAIEVPDDSEVAKAEGKNKTKTITEKYWDWDQANETQPIWMRNSKEVTQEQYNEFYKAAFNEYLEPLACSHFNTEGEVEFRSILYVPAMSPMGKDDILNAKTKNIRLYVKRVFISDDFDGELFPRYLSFIKGVVDSNDLPLNVSREILQESRIVRVMRKRLVKKSFEMIASIAQKNAEDYKKFWENFGRFLKIGVLEDKSSHKQLAPLLRFFTSYSEDEYLSLDQYVESMKEGQKSIYYIAADSIMSARNAPFLEKLLEKELEVLYLIEPIDEVAIQALKSYKDKPFVDITKEELDLGDKDEVKEKEVEKEFTPVCEWMKNHLGDKVAKVQISNRLSASPCVLVAGKFGWSANMERLMKAQPMSDPAGMEFMRGRRVLEINPNHPIIRNLSIACKDSANDTEARKAIDLLFDTALVSSGYSPDNPAELGVKIYDMMNMALSGKFGYVAPEVPPPQPSGETASELKDTAATELKVEDGATTLPSDQGEVKAGSNSATATATAPADRGEVTEAEVVDTPKTETQ